MNFLAFRSEWNLGASGPFSMAHAMFQQGKQSDAASYSAEYLPHRICPLENSMLTFSPVATESRTMLKHKPYWQRKFKRFGVFIHRMLPHLRTSLLHMDTLLHATELYGLPTISVLSSLHPYPGVGNLNSRYLN
jgi:hypothetical protein